MRFALEDAQNAALLFDPCPLVYASSLKTTGKRALQWPTCIRVSAEGPVRIARAKYNLDKAVPGINADLLRDGVLLGVSAHALGCNSHRCLLRSLVTECGDAGSSWTPGTGLLGPRLLLALSEARVLFVGDAALGNLPNAGY